MEAYKMSCHDCGKIRFWVGYKTGLGKSAEQLRVMKEEHTTCQYCGSKNVHSGLDRESAIGQDFNEMDNLAASFIVALFTSRTKDMLDVLHDVERALPALLADHHRWKSVLVDYHAPIVERVWCEWSGYRISLHRIHPCKKGEALFHPHPWPSAMKVLSGDYEMAIGYGAGEVSPPVAAKIILGAGSEYEMTDLNGWHYVRPLNVPTMSLIVTGKPWDRSAPKSDKALIPLLDGKREEILQFFRSVYK